MHGTLSLQIEGCDSARPSNSEMSCRRANSRETRKCLSLFAKNYPLLLGLVSVIGASFSALAQPANPEASSTPSASPSATPAVFSAQTLADLKRLQQAALTSDYALNKSRIFRTTSVRA